MHQTGEMDDMSRTINRLLSHDKLTAEAMDEIYEQFFGRYFEEAELRDASQRIERTVAEVSDCIDTASGSAERYGVVLAGFTDSADQLVDKDGDANIRMVSELSQAIGTVLAETRQMAKRTAYWRSVYSFRRKRFRSCADISKCSSARPASMR